MKAKRFVELIELAISELYGEESNFDTVPYIHEDQGPMVRCLGVFLTEDMKMAAVSAKAMELVHQNSSVSTVTDEMIEFVDLMENMEVAPYMQWHCAYWPGLTQDQVDAGTECFVDPEPGDRPASEVLGGDPPRKLTAHELFTWLEHAGASARWYSGRMMYGRECVAITGSPAVCQDGIASAIVCMMDGEDRELVDLDDAIRRMMHFTTDNLGNDIVMYWPEELRPEGDAT